MPAMQVGVLVLAMGLLLGLPPCGAGSRLRRSSDAMKHIADADQPAQPIHALQNSTAMTQFTACQKRCVRMYKPRPPDVGCMRACAQFLPGPRAALIQQVANATPAQTTYEPPVAVPGQWLTDKNSTVVILPLRVPRTRPMDDLVLRTDGRSLVVQFSERPAPQPENPATAKFRLILEAFKHQASGSSIVLADKLRQWETTEDSVSVRSLIAEALQGLPSAGGTNPRQRGTPPSVHLVSAYMQASVALDDDEVDDGKGYFSTPSNAKLLQQAQLALQSAPTVPEPMAGDVGDGDLVLGPDSNGVDFLEPLGAEAGAFAAGGSLGANQVYVKESLRLPLPFPARPEDVFAVVRRPGLVVLCAPRPQKGHPELSALPARRIFERVQVYDAAGVKMSISGAGSDVATDLEPEVKARVRKMHGGKVVAAGV